jgi:myo-inositol-1(or 4)-monophosphatase
MSEETDHLLEFARTLASSAADAILPQFRKNIAVEVKAAKDWDPVTEGDKAAERVIRALIERHFPTHGIIGEEYGTKEGSSAYTWVLDPIDGTRSFVIGMPSWATLIGLYRDGKPLLGVMNQPYVGDMFYGSPEGAWLDHRGHVQPIKCRAPLPLKQAAAGTTSPYLYPEGSKFETMRKSVQMMRYGGDAYFFSLVAAGHLDIAMDAGLQIYDIAALIPIVTGAGGVVGTWDGKDPAQGGNIIAASSPALLDEARAIMQG